MNASLIPAILSKEHLLETILSGRDHYRVEIRWVASLLPVAVAAESFPVQAYIPTKFGLEFIRGRDCERDLEERSRQTHPRVPAGDMDAVNLGYLQRDV
jgi:hypothetical protein